MCYNIDNEREVIEMNHNWYFVFAIISLMIMPFGQIFNILFLICPIATFAFMCIWGDKENDIEWENYKKSIDNNSKV